MDLTLRRLTPARPPHKVTFRSKESMAMFHVSNRSQLARSTFRELDDHVRTTLETLTDRRSVLRGAAGLAATALGAASTGSVAHASSATFPVSVDATRLVYRYFVIPGVTSGWTDSRTVQTFNLAPGQYSFQIASGYYADFTFTVS